MKKIIKYILCFILVVCISCDASLLDIQNENTLSTGVFWKTKQILKPALLPYIICFIVRVHGHEISTLK